MQLHVAERIIEYKMSDTLNYRAIIFDLDGTLLDTLADIGEAVNSALAEVNLPGYPIDVFRQFIGDGLKMTVTRALPETRRSDPFIQDRFERTRAIYSERWNNKTRLYDGISELLGSLRNLDVKMAVLSNKPHDFTLKCVAHYLNPWEFEAVIGMGNAFPPKPDPAGALEIARRMGLPPGEVLFLGDSSTDMKTASAAGMFPVGAAWGFRGSAELVESGCRELVHHPLDLMKLIQPAG